MKLFISPAARSVLLLITTLCASGVMADDHMRRQIDSHEHGITTLNIALDGNELVLQLEGPGMNFVGFEHAAHTAKQTQTIADALAALEDGEQLFSIDSDAKCVLAEGVALHITEDEADDDHDGHDDDHNDEHANHTDDTDDSQHSEFVGEYLYLCDNPGEVGQISVKIFESFPLTTEIETSFLGPKVQTFKNLTPADPELRLNDE
jgi:hypothetical protein